jgi:hypothetical protein
MLPVTAEAVAPDGTWLANASDHWTVQIWDPAPGSTIAAIGDFSLYLFEFNSYCPAAGRCHGVRSDPTSATLPPGKGTPT